MGKNEIVEIEWLDEFDDMHMSQPKTALLREALMRKGLIDAQNLPEDAVVFFKEVCNENAT